MFDGGVGTADTFEQVALGSERRIARERARQIEAIRHLAQAQVDLVDGCRSMIEWVASRLAVSLQLARDLVFLARACDDEIERLLAAGEIGLERAVAMARLRQAGASADVISQSFGYDLAGIAKLIGGFKRLTAAGETAAFETRYLILQPSLDESALKYWGQATGADGQIIEKALFQRADELPTGPRCRSGSKAGGRLHLYLHRLPHRR